MQPISTSSEHDALTSGRTESILVIYFVDTLAAGPIADIHNIDSLGSASVRPTGLSLSPGTVQFQRISTSSEHDALASGRSESSLVIYLVDTFGGGPIADIHIVYI